MIFICLISHHLFAWYSVDIIRRNSGLVTRVKRWVKLLRTREIQAFLYLHNMNKVIKKTLNNSPSVFCGKTSWVLNFNHWNISWNLLVSVALGYLCYLSGCRIGLWVKKDKKQKSTEVRVKKKKKKAWLLVQKIKELCYRNGLKTLSYG